MIQLTLAHAAPVSLGVPLQCVNASLAALKVNDCGCVAFDLVCIIADMLMTMICIAHTHTHTHTHTYTHTHADRRWTTPTHQRLPSQRLYMARAHSADSDDARATSQ